MFGDLELLAEFQSRPPVNGLDLFVVWNSDDFESPWISYPEPEVKSGSLRAWGWQRTGEGEATYRAMKLRAEDDATETSLHRAVKFMSERSSA